MGTSTSGARPVLFLAAVAVAATVSGVLAPRTTRAGEDGRVRLLVACDRDVLPDLLREIRARHAQAWDLESMTLLTPAEAEPAAPEAREVARPADGLGLMKRLLAAVDGLHATAACADLRVEELAVQQRRALLSCTASDPACFDAVRRALAEDAHLASRARVADRLVELGAQQRLPDGRWKQGFSLALREDEERGTQPASTATSIPTALVQRAGLAVRVQLLYASAERVDPDRARVRSHL
jgi:hypothetical protein